MYIQRLLLLLAGGIFLGIPISSVEAAFGPVKRFSINKKAVGGVQTETKAQIYARSLTAKKPTRRSTAQRRQVSPAPTIPGTISATDRFFGTDLGGLVYRSATNDWVVSTDAPPAVLNVPAAGFSATSTSRMTTQSGNSLAWQSCDELTVTEAASFTLGSGSIRSLCLTDVADPIGPGSPPGTIVIPGGAVRVYESDVWGNTPGVVQWTNPDLSKATITLIRLTSTYHFPTGPQLVGLADVPAYLQYLTTLQIEAGFPLVDYPLSYEFISLQIA